MTTTLPVAGMVSPEIEIVVAVAVHVVPPEQATPLTRIAPPEPLTPLGSASVKLAVVDDPALLEIVAVYVTALPIA